jgi:hypothetical protein
VLLASSLTAQLSKRDLHVDDVTTDFVDGIKLIVLLEILAGNSLGKYNKKLPVANGNDSTVLRQGQLLLRQNLEKALNFCTSQGATHG